MPLSSLRQGVGLLPAAGGECYTGLLTLVVTTATAEEARLRVEKSCGGKVWKGTQPGPVAVEQLHISMSISVVATRHQHKGV